MKLLIAIVQDQDSLILVDEKEDEICKISGNVDIATLKDIIGDIMNGKYNWSLR